MNLRNRRKSEGKVHMEALNDILFILLFFFLIIATLANPNVIQMANAKSESDTRVNQNIVVSVDGEKNFYVGTTPVLRENLKDSLSVILSNIVSEEAPVVVINSDSTATAADIVQIMRIARELKAKSVLSVAKP